jgi:hypothetical protein
VVLDILFGEEVENDVKHWYVDAYVLEDLPIGLNS